MTAIAVKRFEDYISISADTSVSYGRNKFDTTYWNMLKHFSKIKKINKIVYWSAWYVEDSIRFGNFLTTNLPEWNTLWDIERFVLKYYEYLKWFNWDIDVKRSSYILIISDKIYRINWYLIAEVSDYYAIGSWDMICLTAMHLWYDDKKAIETAIELSFWVWWNIETLTMQKGIDF